MGKKKKKNKKNKIKKQIQQTQVDSVEMTEDVIEFDIDLYNEGLHKIKNKLGTDFIDVIKNDNFKINDDVWFVEFEEDINDTITPESVVYTQYIPMHYIRQNNMYEKKKIKVYDSNSVFDSENLYLNKQQMYKFVQQILGMYNF